MVLPLVPLIIVVGTIATGGSGAAFGSFGGLQIKRARDRIKLNAARYETRHNEHVLKVGQSNRILQKLGSTQERARDEVIFRMRDFLLRNEKQVRANEHLIFDGLDGANTRIAGSVKLAPDVAGWARGVFSATIAGAAVPQLVRGGVVKLATAGTGTAIAALSGAAAESATLAFLGGGALAAGGGGVALGATMLNVATIGPTVLIVGLTVKNRGTKARTEAAKHEGEIAIAIATLDGRDQLLRGVDERAQELDSILHRLVAQAVSALDVLESEPFDVDLHAERLQAALILVKSVRDVATAPVADEDGNLDEQTTRIVFKYRGIPTEASDD